MPQFPFAEAAARFTLPRDRDHFAELAQCFRGKALRDVFKIAASRAQGAVRPYR